MAETPPPATERKSVGVGDGELPGLGGLAHDGVGERVLRAALGGGDEGEDLLLGERALGTDDVGDAGLALGEGAGLVEDDGLHRPQPLERLGVAEQDPVLGALAGTDHDRGRRREAERARARDDQDGDRVEQREVERGLGPEREPDHERERREPEDHRHEVAGDHVGEALDRRPGALGLGDEPDDLREDRVGADPRGPEGQRPRRVERAADDEVLDPLGDREALAGDHRLVDARGALGDHAVDRDRLAGADAHEVADADVADREVELDAITDDARGARREVDEAADRVGGVAARAGLEEAAEQDQRDDRRRGVEVHRQRLAIHAEARRR